MPCTHRSTVAVLIAGLMLSAGLAPAQERERPLHQRGPPPLDRLLDRHADRLGLSDETLARIRQIAGASRADAERIRAELRERHAELRLLLATRTPDRAAILRQAERIGAAETERQKHRLRTMLQIRALLTPEQREALVRLHEERRHRGEGPPR